MIRLVARRSGVAKIPDRRPVTLTPRRSLAIPVADAAASLGLSENTSRHNVLPHIRSIKVGRMLIVPVIELERWVHLNARFVDED